MQNQSIPLSELIRRITDTIAEELDEWRRKSRILAQNRSHQQHNEYQRQSLALWCTRSAQSLRILYSLLTLLTLHVDDENTKEIETTKNTSSPSSAPSTTLVLDKVNEWNNTLVQYRNTYQYHLNSIGQLQRSLFGTRIPSSTPNQALQFIHDAIEQYNKVHSNDNDNKDEESTTIATVSSMNPSSASSSFRRSKTSLLQYLLGWKLLYLQSIIPSYISLGLHLHHILLRINQHTALSLTSTGSLDTTSTSLFAITGIYWNGTGIGSLVDHAPSAASSLANRTTKPVSKPSYNQLRQIQTILQNVIDKYRYSHDSNTSLASRMEQQLYTLIENFNAIVHVTALLEMKNNLVRTENWLHQSTNSTVIKSSTFQPSITWYPSGHKLLVSLWTLPDANSSLSTQSGTEVEQNRIDLYDTNKRTSLAVGNTYVLTDNGAVYPLQRTLWNTKSAPTITKLFENETITIESLHGMSSATSSKDVFLEGVSTSVTEEIHLVIDPETGLPTYASGGNSSTNPSNLITRNNGTSKNSTVTNKTVVTVQTMENDSEMNGSSSPIINNLMKASKVNSDTNNKRSNPITVLHDQPSPVILSTYLTHAESPWISGDTPYQTQKSLVIHNDISQHLYETNQKLLMLHKWSAASNPFSSSNKTEHSQLSKPFRPQIVVRQMTADPIAVQSSDFPDSVSVISETLCNTMIDMMNILLSNRPDTKTKAQQIGLHHTIERVPGEILGIQPTAKSRNPLSSVLLLSIPRAFHASSRAIHIRMGIDNRTGEITLNLDHHPSLEAINADLQKYLNRVAQQTSERALLRTAQLIEPLTTPVSSFVSRQNIALEPRISSIVASVADKFTKDMDTGAPSPFAEVGVLESRGSIFSAPLGQDRDASVHSSLFLTSVIRARLLASLLLPGDASADTVLQLIESISKYSFQTNHLLSFLPSVFPSSSPTASRDNYQFVRSLLTFITSQMNLSSSNVCDMVGSHVHLPIVHRLFTVSNSYACRLDNVSLLNASSRSYIAAALMAVSYTESLLSIMDNIMIMIHHRLRVPSNIVTNTGTKPLMNRFLLHETSLRLVWNTVTNTVTRSNASIELAPYGSFIPKSSCSVSDLVPWVHYGTSRNSHDGTLSVTPTVLYTIPSHQPATMTIRDASSTASGSTYTYPHIRILHTITDIRTEGRPMVVPNELIQEINQKCQSLPSGYRLSSTPTTNSTVSTKKIYCVDLPTVLVSNLFTFTQIFERSLPVNTTTTSSTTTGTSMMNTHPNLWQSSIQFLQTIIDTIDARQHQLSSSDSITIILLLPSSFPSSVSLTDLWLPLSFTNIHSTVLLVHENLGSAIRRTLATTTVTPSSTSTLPLPSMGTKGRPSMYGSGNRNLMVASALKDPILHLTVPWMNSSSSLSFPAASVHHILGIVQANDTINMNDLPLIVMETGTKMELSHKRTRIGLDNDGMIHGKESSKLMDIEKHIDTFLGPYRV